MHRMPRNPQKAILGKRYTIALIVQAFSIGILSFISYVVALDVEHLSEEQARSETFAVLFITQCAHAFMCRSIRNSLVTSGAKEMFLGNRWLFGGSTFSMAAVVAGLYVPGFNDIFGLMPIDGRAWGKVALAIVVHLGVVELGKWFIRGVKPKSASGGAFGTATPLVRSPVAAVGGDVAEAEADKEKEGGVEKALTGAGETV